MSQGVSGRLRFSFGATLVGFFLRASHDVSERLKYFDPEPSLVLGHSDQRRRVGGVRAPGDGGGIGITSEYRGAARVRIVYHVFLTPPSKRTRAPPLSVDSPLYRLAPRGSDGTFHAHWWSWKKGDITSSCIVHAK